MSSETLKRNMYPVYFIVPAMLIYTVIFIIPTFGSFFYSFTHWTLSDWEFIGLENYRTFFSEPSLRIGLKNTLIYGFGTCFGKVVIGLLLTQGLRIEQYLRTVVFVPTIPLQVMDYPRMKRELRLLKVTVARIIEGEGGGYRRFAHKTTLLDVESAADVTSYVQDHVLNWDFPEGDCPYLPVLMLPEENRPEAEGSGPCFDFTSSQGERTRYDYERTLADLFIENFLEKMTRWRMSTGSKDGCSATVM